MRSANEVFPELKDLETLPMHDMALRLCFLFDHYDKTPVCEHIRCALYHVHIFHLQPKLMLLRHDHES